MARKKTPPKPMFELRHDFVDSLENVCQQGIMLLQVVDTLIQHNAVKENVRELLKERRNAFAAALMGNVPDLEN